MNKNPKSAAVRFWGWIALAFCLGTVFGFAACIVTMIVVQATISYAQ